MDVIRDVKVSLSLNRVSKTFKVSIPNDITLERRNKQGPALAVKKKTKEND